MESHSSSTTADDHNSLNTVAALSILPIVDTITPPKTTQCAISFSEGDSSFVVGSPAPLLGINAVSAFDPKVVGLGEARQKVEDGGKNNNSDSMITANQVSCFVYLIVIVLCLLFFAQGGVDNALGPCALTTIQEEFNTTNMAVIAAQRMAEVTKTGSAIFLGHLAVSKKLIYVCAGSVIFAIGSVLVGISPSLWFAGIGYFIYGFGYSTTLVLTPPIINDFVTNKGRGACYIGITMCVLVCGVMVFFIICALNTEKWRLLYIGLGLASLLPTMFFVLTQRSKLLLRQGGEEGLSSEKSSGESSSAKKVLPPLQQHRLPFFKTIWALLTTRKVIFWVTMALLFAQFHTSAFVSFLPKFVEVHHQKSKETAGLVMAAIVPAVAISVVIGGWIVKRWQLHLLGMSRFASICTIFAVPFVTLTWLIPHLGIFIPVIALGMFITYLPASACFACLPYAVRCQEEVSYANSIIQFVARLFGAVAGPIFMGLLIDKDWFGFQGAFVFIGGVGSTLSAVAAACAWYCYSPEEYPDTTLTPSPSLPPNGGGEVPQDVKIQQGEVEMKEHPSTEERKSTALAGENEVKEGSPSASHLHLSKMEGKELKNDDTRKTTSDMDGREIQEET